MSSAAPNPAHLALAALERAGALLGVITQNVDRLHRAAGSTRVIELHGALEEVRCLACQALESRHTLQARMLAHNPGFEARTVELAPDGDAELPLEAVRDFQVPECLTCGGVLKPDVVFFGDNVPRDRVDAAFALLDEADALLIVGTSLAVFSGYRFVLRAAERALRIALVNQGESRGTELAHVHVDAPASAVLTQLVGSLIARQPRA
jgi:NAD-dependent SIR2 family protein deacetylase